MRSEIAERANGRWRGILSSLGVGSHYLTGKHGPCPICGEGKDRFRWDNKEGKGTFYCTRCGAGDGFKLLMLLKGWDFPQAAREVQAIVGGVKVEPTRPRKSDAECRAAMRKRWRSCGAVEVGGPVERYLVARTGLAVFPPVIRSALDRPCMVALMQDPSGRATMVHQTFLTADGRKAQTDKPRLLMPGTIAKGSAVRLAEHGDELGIAEGIETALSATVLFGIPCWSALNEVLLQQWQWPESVRKVHVFGDNDLNFVGHSAAYALARRIALTDRTMSVEVRIPQRAGWDWNDVLRTERGEAKAA